MIRLLIAISLGAYFLPVNSTPQNDKEREPPLVFILTLDGKKQVLEENSEIPIDGEFTNPKTKIRLAGYRNFRRNDITFRYPHAYEFEYEHVDGVRTWSLYGEDGGLAVYVTDDESEAFIQSAIKQTAAITGQPDQIVKLKRDKIQVNGINLDTYEYSINFGDGYISHIWAVALPGSGKTRILAFDREFENKKLLKECAVLEKMVTESLEWK